jgi:hypothetical protein
MSLFATTLYAHDRFAGTSVTSLCQTLLVRNVEKEPTRSQFVTGFHLLPPFMRSVLARGNSAALRSAQLERLHQEAFPLIPLGTLSFMAMISQRSFEYLLNSFPQAPSSGTPRGRWDAERDHQAYWARRLALMRDKLLEIHSLGGADGTTHLTLGIIYGFSYGFENLDTQSSPLRETRIYEKGGGFFHSIEQAHVHFTEALRLVSQEQGEHSTAALFIKFLLGKHALHAAQVDAFSYREKPKAFEYLAIARQMLTSVFESLRADTSNQRATYRSSVTPLAFQELLFEARYWLLEINATEGRYDYSSNSRNQRRATLRAKERLLIDLLLTAPQDWVEGQFQNRSSLLARLIRDLRLHAADSGDVPRRDFFYLLQERLGTPSGLTYDVLMRTLIENLGYAELRAVYPGL